MALSAVSHTYSKPLFKIIPIIGFSFFLTGPSFLLHRSGIHVSPPNLPASSARPHLFRERPLSQIASNIYSLFTALELTQMATMK